MEYAYRYSTSAKRSRRIRMEKNRWIRMLLPILMAAGIALCAMGCSAGQNTTEQMPETSAGNGEAGETQEEDINAEELDNGHEMTF